MIATSSSMIVPRGSIIVPETSTILVNTLPDVIVSGTAIYANGQLYVGSLTGTSATASTSVIFDDRGTGWHPVTTATTSTYWGVGYSAAGDICWSYPVSSYDPAAREKSHREYEKKRLHNIIRAKTSIKKALKLIDNVGFGNEVRVFLGGDSIEVSHPDSAFKFVLTKPYSVIDKTLSPGASTPYKLELYTKTDVHVADLCVYMKDTPVLDQVLAITMFIRAGDEEMVMAKANWSRRTGNREVIKLLQHHYPTLPKLVNRANVLSLAY